MPEFLKLNSLGSALKILKDALPPQLKESEIIETTDALGRIIAEDVLSNEYSPAFNHSTADGYAVIASNTFGASDSLPSYLRLVGEVAMGARPGFSIKGGEAAVIHTGGMLPDGADAVVMLETAQVFGADEIEVYKPVTENENLVLKGEDIKPGDIMIPHGTRVRPEEIGGLLALGLTRVKVIRKPVVSIFSTGDEIVPPDLKPAPGQVRDINSYTLAALVQQLGGKPDLHEIVRDDPDHLEDAIRRSLANTDLVIVTAGSSASERDMTAEVINRFGKPGVLVHGVNVRPGKPTILAVCDGKPMVGLPGNPVSALVIARLVVSPILDHLTGWSGTRHAPTVRARLETNLPSQSGRDDFYPVTLRKEGDEWMAVPVYYKSSLIFSLTRADGLVHIPADVTGYSAGENVAVTLM